jgi:hypothetical protein
MRDKGSLLCGACRAVLRSERQQHVIRHNEQPQLGTPKKRRERKAKAEAKQLSVNEILRLAELNGISYGVAVARLKEGKL